MLREANLIYTFSCFNPRPTKIIQLDFLLNINAKNLLILIFSFDNQKFPVQGSLLYSKVFNVHFCSDLHGFRQY